MIPFRDVKRKLAVGFIKSFNHLLEAHVANGGGGFPCPWTVAAYQYRRVQQPSPLERVSQMSAAI